MDLPEKVIGCMGSLAPSTLQYWRTTENVVFYLVFNLWLKKTNESRHTALEKILNQRSDLKIVDTTTKVMTKDCHTTIDT